MFKLVLEKAEDPKNNPRWQPTETANKRVRKTRKLTDRARLV